MITNLRTWWHGLSARERWLVGIAAAICAAALLWYAVLMPTTTGLTSARERHQIAVERHAGMAARVRLAAQAQTAGPPAAGSSGRVDLLLSQSAAEQGFILSRNDVVGDNASSIAIGNSRAGALLTWIGVLERQGLIADELNVRPNADGTVALTATIRRVR